MKYSVGNKIKQRMALLRIAENSTETNLNSPDEWKINDPVQIELSEFRDMDYQNSMVSEGQDLDVKFYMPKFDNLNMSLTPITLVHEGKVATRTEAGWDLEDGQKIVSNLDGSIEYVTENAEGGEVKNPEFEEVKPKDGMTGTEGSDKVAVPAELKTALNKRISELKGSIEKYPEDEKYVKTDPRNIDPRKSAVEALEKLASYLDGTREGFNNAANYWPTLWSGIRDMVPPALIDFLVTRPD